MPSVRSIFPDIIFCFANPHSTLISHETNQVAFYNLSAPASAGVQREDTFWAEGKNYLGLIESVISP